MKQIETNEEFKELNKENNNLRNEIKELLLKVTRMRQRALQQEVWLLRICWA